MSKYNPHSKKLQRVAETSNTVSIVSREPLPERIQRVQQALATINHVTVKITPYGRYIAPVAA